jgi:hypothetical protein
MVRSWIEGFLFNTDYGIALLVSPIVGIAWITYKLSKGSLLPFYIAGGLIVLAFLNVPSIPRFLFERRILEKAASAPGIRLVNSSRWGDLLAPITWFYTPYGFFRFVGPFSPIEDIKGPNRTFRELIFAYGEEPHVYIREVFCDNGEYSIAAPDETGVFRILDKDWQKLSAEDKKVFCEEDWTKEQEELRRSASQGGRG